jgi:hypothetical protein
MLVELLCFPDNLGFMLNCRTTAEGTSKAPRFTRVHSGPLMGSVAKSQFCVSDGDAVHKDTPAEPAMMEVILGPDGTTTFRVYGDNAVKETTHDTAGAKAWNQEIAKLKATPKGEGR